MKFKLDHFGILAPFYEHFIKASLPEKLLGWVDLPAGGAVLDAGGGTGWVAQFLREQAGLIVVADESRGMLREAQSKTGLLPVCAHTERLPFADSTFDRILMVDALHHVADQAHSAAELWRILKPGGRIVIEEPDVRSLGVKFIAIAEKLALMRSHFLSPPEISSLFRSVNARVRVEVDGSTAWVIVEKE